MLIEGIGEIDDIVIKMQNEEEQKFWIRKSGYLIGHLVSEIQQPTIELFPELKLTEQEIEVAMARMLKRPNESTDVP